ncbi:LysR family transcriptional regulator [Endozoicomonas sp. SCSIO W0465]|uniref:LysR family transcriptional regulator n=1 Tax=Endozoicomonas sp. SCSIO W0465 TaxID=2918516 RepID=UPI002075D48A|nr:LysR family transcriptional regulator [Endozoicomonas sp. SCSIO W0465]USE35011.1 LysR family transcriptional regulator [Endozoicomonas sp. SCSIO W0465]
MSSLEFKWLDDFISLKDLGNFSAAAAARHVTQSAFSRRIQALEFWVGVPLFDRTSYPIKLTEDGKKFVPYVEKMLQLIRETADDFSQASLRTDNTVRIVCLHSFALNLLPELFSKAGKRLEGLNFSLTPSIQGIDNHFQALLDNACDIIFVYDTQGMRPSFLLEDKVERMLVATTRIIPVIAPQLLDSLTDQQPLPYLAYSKQTFLVRPAWA